jgi:hypothetical protein
MSEWGRGFAMKKKKRMNMDDGLRTGVIRADTGVLSITTIFRFDYCDQY